jgi:hypothetical protein
MSSTIPPYLIDFILPAYEVHLLAGVSDAGKTRWLFHALLEWEQGHDIFDPIHSLHSHPVPWVYVAGDRTERAAIRTLQDMGMNPNAIPLIPAFGSSHKPMHRIIEEAHKRGAHLIVVEGFQKFIEGAGQARDVQQFLENMSGYTDPHQNGGCTILGVVESPKLKPNERYDDPRQRVSGVSAWGYYSNTIFLIERNKADLKSGTDSPNRTMFVCPKQGKRLTLPGGFDQQGHLTFP